jgi:hypothetical protein
MCSFALIRALEWGDEEWWRSCNNHTTFAGEGPNQFAAFGQANSFVVFVVFRLHLAAPFPAS